MKEQPMSDEKTMGQVIQIDEARIRDHLGEMVRGTVEETLNAMLDAEADQLCGAGRYERSKARQDTCPFRKFHPAWIRVPWQNRPIMKNDVCDPSCPWKVPCRPVQVAQPA
jgi:hypothetical protein